MRHNPEFPNFQILKAANQQISTSANQHISKSAHQHPVSPPAPSATSLRIIKFVPKTSIVL
jgi:hypothetical protein